MADIVSPSTRSRIMSGIKSKNTQPELLIRRSLHASGFRFRLHSKALPGKPDLVFRKYSSALFVNGCFWHGHNCHLFRQPTTRPEFWSQKIKQNRVRDEKNIASLNSQGWKTGIVWECALKGRSKQPLSDVLEQLTEWLTYGQASIEIRGYE